MVANELLKIVKEILKIKNMRRDAIKWKADHYQKYKSFLGKEQELTRQINEQLEELEMFK